MPPRCSDLIAADGIFSPSFSCIGPEVAVCAPGVAIVSTVPGGFEPQSGTSTAAPHVTGLAALLLAHHPAFLGPLSSRTQERVAALFSMIRWLCVPYGFGAERTGAGLPRLHGVEQVLQPGPEQRVALAVSSVLSAPASAAPWSIRCTYRPRSWARRGPSRRCSNRCGDGPV